MSSYLEFRKDDVRLCCFSRNSKVYQAFANAPYDKWEAVNSTQLSRGIDELKEERASCYKNINVYREMAEHQMDYDNLYSTIKTVKEYQDEIKEINTAINYIELLIDIADTDSTDEDNLPQSFEWSVG